MENLENMNEAVEEVNATLETPEEINWEAKCKLLQNNLELA